MLHGELIGLRVRQDSDIEVFETELLNEVEVRIRSEVRPWRPIPPGSPESPYRERPSDHDDPAKPAKFAVVELATGDLAGDALLWGIDLHNRGAHIGLTMRPAYRGKHLGTDVVRVLCHYGFDIRGLHRLQIETLADNHAMIASATRAGFVQEGTLRQAAWVDGRFTDELIFGRLTPNRPRPA